MTVYRSLGNVTNDDLDYIDPSDLPYYAGDTTNLEGAMQAAMDQFATSNHRVNAKKVIVVVATTFNPTGVTAPQQVATQFKESGGILVIYGRWPPSADTSPPSRLCARTWGSLRQHPGGDRHPRLLLDQYRSPE